MRMKPETYDIVLDEARIVIAKLEETGTRLHPAREFDAENITMRDMWDILLVANMDRANEYHPRHDREGLVPRCLEFTDRTAHWLWNREDQGGEDLDDSHIETALRKIVQTVATERAAGVPVTALETATTPAPRF